MQQPPYYIRYTWWGFYIVRKTIVIYVMSDLISSQIWCNMLRKSIIGLK